VLPIGGLKEKTMAAYAAGVHTVLIPKGNEKDLDEIDAEARAHLSFVLCESVEDAFREVLLEAKADASTQATPPVFSPRPAEGKQTQLCGENA
jgi:ATP-dependent Lon protease